MTTPELTNLERRRIQMEYVVPLIRDLQRLIGTETVNEALARRAEPEDGAPGSSADFSRMAAGVETFAAGDALDYEIIASDEDSFDLNITRCSYEEMMDELGARDIGHLLICNLDYPAAAQIGMDLERTQTRMQGASHCDFRYRRRS
ncbi:MAG: L-2-amino-thiazoline-4-carboxylic acid hydrolase [Pseudomonadota bacterium]